MWRDQQVTPPKLHLIKLLRSVSVDVIGAEKPNLLCIASPPPKSLVVFCSHLSVTLTVWSFPAGCYNISLVGCQ